MHRPPTFSHLDHICVQLGHTLPTPPSLPGHLARTYVGTPPQGVAM